MMLMMMAVMCRTWASLGSHPSAKTAVGGLVPALPWVQVVEESGLQHGEVQKGGAGIH